ncbi:MAG: hypothetical protein WC455_13000 [Dehalococcoidia bacterium]|jgi:hypothetical protein
MKTIAVNGTKLIINEVDIDLSEYAGKKVTVFEETDGSLTIESKPYHYKSICELQVPLPVITSVDTGKKDKEGVAITEDSFTPIDLDKAVIRKFEEVANGADERT